MFHKGMSKLFVWRLHADAKQSTWHHAKEEQRSGCKMEEDVTSLKVRGLSASAAIYIREQAKARGLTENAFLLMEIESLALGYEEAQENTLDRQLKELTPLLRLNQQVRQHIYAYLPELAMVHERQEGEGDG
ncbi:hypothetical protein EP56_01790 [Listeriaceae bacterium FSL A5-0209]|nr:hypothetical protein EP56_01790 [Listeriaceae bacterium FSL A5-0209]